MAYEEKKSSYDEAADLEPIIKLIKQVLNKWWLIVIFVVTFSIVSSFVNGKILLNFGFKQLKFSKLLRGMWFLKT